MKKNHKHHKILLRVFSHSKKQKYYEFHVSNSWSLEMFSGFVSQNDHCGFQNSKTNARFNEPKQSKLVLKNIKFSQKWIMAALVIIGTFKILYLRNKHSISSQNKAKMSRMFSFSQIRVFAATACCERLPMIASEEGILSQSSRLEQTETFSRGVIFGGIRSQWLPLERQERRRICLVRSRNFSGRTLAASLCYDSYSGA